MRNSQVGDLLVATTEVDGTVLSRGVCLLVYEDEQTAVGVMLNRPLVLAPAAPALANEPPPAGMLNDAMLNLDGQSETTPKSQRLSDKMFASKADDSIESSADGSQANNHNDNTTPPMLTLIGPANDPGASQLLAGQSLHFGGPLSGPIVAVHGAAELAEAEAGEGIFVAAQRDHLEALLQAGQPHPYRLIVGHLGWTQEQLSAEILAGVWHRIPATAEILSTADEWLWPRLIRSATANSVSRWIGQTHVADAHLLN